MACALTKGFALDCRDAIGGIKDVWIFKHNPSLDYTISASLITDIEGLEASKVFNYQVRRENGSFTETINNSLENDSIFYTQELTFSMSKLDSTKRNELYLVAKANVSVIFLDNNGKYFLLGKNYGLQLSGTGASGVAFGDKSGYDLVLSGNETEAAYEVHAGWIGDLE